jgi:hypothetical protein
LVVGEIGQKLALAGSGNLMLLPQIPVAPSDPQTTPQTPFSNRKIEGKKSLGKFSKTRQKTGGEFWDFA